MKTPHIVNLSRQDVQGRSLRLTVGTEIMDHYEPVQLFGRDDIADLDAFSRFQRRMIAIPDRRASVIAPMVLTLSSDNQLYLIRQDAQSEGGWLKVNLSQAFVGRVPGTPKIHAIGAGWTDDDRITLAIAVEAQAGQDGSRLFMAYDLTSQTTDWSTISWVDCGTRDQIRIEGLRVLPERDRTWTTVISGDRGPNDMLYLLRSNLKQTFREAFVFNPAVRMDAIFDFEVGVHPIFGGGIHLLGMSGQARVLMFRPFPRYNLNGSIRTIPPVIPLPCPAGASVLESGMTRRTGADLYIAGQGIHLLTPMEIFENRSEARLIQVASSDSAPGIEDLIVGEQPDGSVAVWALLRTGDLLVVKRQGEEDWQPALLLRHGVQAIAPVEGDAHSETSVLVVYSDFRASFICQDKVAKVWQETPLLIANPAELHQTTCYGTKLRVLDEFGLPQSNVPVTVSASTLSSVRINKNAAFIGPAVSFITQTDEEGSVTILDRVVSFTPAVYRFSIEGLKDSFDVNPASQMHHRFEAMTVDELMNAKIQTPAGQESLLPGTFLREQRHQVDAVVSVLQQTARLTRSADGEGAGIRKVGADQAYSSALQPNTVPDNYRWGIRADASGVRSAEGSLVDKLSRAAESSADFFTNLGSSIADFFEGLGDRIREGFTVVMQKAEQAFEVICELGGKIKRFALKTLQEVGSFFKWLWEQIKVGVGKLMDWLKFLFNWDDILIVRDALVHCTDEVLDYLADSVADLKKPVSKSFEQLLGQVRAWNDETEDPQDDQSSISSRPLIAVLSKVSGAQQQILDQIKSNPALTWVTERISDFMSELIQFEGANPLETAENTAIKFIENVGMDQIDNVLEGWQEIQTALQEVFKDQKDFSIFELSLDTLKDLVVKVGGNALEALLEILRDLILHTIELFADIIQIIRDIMFLRVRFPFIEKLFEKLFPGKSLDTSFSLIDGLMLLLAVPVTLSYKLIHGEAPLKKDQRLVLPFNGVVAQSDSDEVRKGIRLLSLLAAFLAPLYTAKRSYDALEEISENEAVASSHSPGPQYLKILIEGFACVQEVLSSFNITHAYKGPLIRDLRWGLVSVSSVNLILQTVMLIPIKTHSKKVEALEKANSVLEACCFSAQLMLQTAIFGIATDHNRNSADDEGKEIAIDSVGFSKHVFDRSGLAIISVSPLFKDPKVQAIVAGVGVVGREIATLLYFIEALMEDLKEEHAHSA